MPWVEAIKIAIQRGKRVADDSPDPAQRMSCRDTFFEVDVAEQRSRRRVRSLLRHRHPCHGAYGSCYRMGVEAGAFRDPPKLRHQVSIRCPKEDSVSIMALIRLRRVTPLSAALVGLSQTVWRGKPIPMRGARSAAPPSHPPASPDGATGSVSALDRPLAIDVQWLAPNREALDVFAQAVSAWPRCRPSSAAFRMARDSRKDCPAQFHLGGTCTAPSGPAFPPEIHARLGIVEPALDVKLR